jgi:type IV pilus assembly protein PilC
MTFLKHKKIPAFEIAVFLRQLSTLISAGIPIIQSYSILAKSQHNKSTAQLIEHIKLDLLNGNSLFNSIYKQVDYFGNLTCQLIKIGELTGKLDAMLSLAAKHHESHQAFKKRVQQALLYPCIISATALFITIAMFLFVIPRFAELFQNTNIQLPTLTIFIFKTAAFLSKHTWTLFIPFILIPCWLFHTHYNHSHKKSIFYSLPLISSILQRISLANFSRHLALTISAGIPITDALSMLAQAPLQTEFAKAINKVRLKISTGLTLHHAMLGLPSFPILLVQMTKIGEESGMLDNMLNKFADFIEADISQLLLQINQLLEPLIMLVLGVLIGGLVIGMYLPIFNLGSAI